MSTNLATHTLRSHRAHSLVSPHAIHPLHRCYTSSLADQQLNNSTWGWLSYISDWKHTYESQAIQYPLTQPQFTPQAEVLVFMMGNVLLLLAALALICVWTPHPEITKWYLIVVAVADMGHTYAAYRGNAQYFFDVASWNDMAWGNIASGPFLCVNRIATVLGLFGPLRGYAVPTKKQL